MRMTLILRKVYHITAFGWYTFVIKSLAAKDGEELPPGIFVYGGPWKYLTFLNVLLQMSFFGLAVVNDLQLGKDSEGSLSRCKDLLFSVFAFPVGMVRNILWKSPSAIINLLCFALTLRSLPFVQFVVLLFWTIFAYDRELVYPATIDTFFPPWINHAMHTFVLPVLFGEVLVQPHVYPQAKHALAALGLVGLAYLSWIIWVYLSVGIWVYPLLGHFSTVGLAGFFVLNMSVVTLLYLLGDKLNRLVWSKDMNKMTADTKKFR